MRLCGESERGERACHRARIRTEILFTRRDIEPSSVRNALYYLSMSPDCPQEGSIALTCALRSESKALYS